MDSLVERMEPKGSLANVSRFCCAANVLSEAKKRQPVNRRQQQSLVRPPLHGIMPSAKS